MNKRMIAVLETKEELRVAQYAARLAGVTPGAFARVAVLALARQVLTDAKKQQAAENEAASAPATEVQA